VQIAARSLQELTLDTATFFRIQVGALGRDFDLCKKNMQAACAEFEAEQNLAIVQVDSQRHYEVMSHLSNSPFNSNIEMITTVSTPRNIMFTGRDKILEALHTKLNRSSASTGANERKRCSCLIHGIGGLGKTEIALEYSYRYRSAYSHIFWLRAESESTLLSSLLEISEKVKADPTGVDIPSKVRKVLDWFNSTSRRHLIHSLVFYS
jgi:hypothetical protein